MRRRRSKREVTIRERESEEKLIFEALLHCVGAMRWLVRCQFEAIVARGVSGDVPSIRVSGSYIHRSAIGSNATARVG
jgi:hypothetical protein